MKLPFSLLPLCLSFVLLSGAPARASRASEDALIQSAKTELYRKGVPQAERIAAARKILEANLSGPTRVPIGIYNHIAAFQESVSHDPQASLQTLDEALKRFPDSKERFTLITNKLDLLAQTDVDAAIALGQEQLPLAQRQNSYSAPYIARHYVRALRAKGQNDAALQVMQTLWHDGFRDIGSPALNWLPGTLAETLTDKGQAQQALAYAKVGWMSAPWEEKALAKATATLVKTWAASDADGAQVAAFQRAQSEPEAPNPLQQVELPPVTEAEVAAQLATAGISPEARITTYIVAGRWNEAMVAARALMVERPNAPQSAAQVARVFKAADLDVRRANAYLAWLQKPQGPNPSSEFLQQHPAP